MIRRLLYAAALAVLATPAFAQDTKPDPQPATSLAAPAAPGADAAPDALQPVTCAEGTNAAPHEREDAELIASVQRAFQQASFAGVRVYVPRLQEAMSHAPACYPEIEQVNDRTILIRGDGTEQPEALSLALGLIAASQGHNTRVVQGDNVYMTVSFLLGSYANEMHNFDEAITWLDRGLALQPHAQMLVSEKAMSLSELNRKDEAHALLRGELDGGSVSLDRARFERMDGIMLIDLNRLDEAETALNESIRLQPNNPVARSELQYIAQLRAGQPSRGNAQMTAPYAPRPQTQ